MEPPIISIIIFFTTFIIGKYFHRKASKYVTEEYKNKFPYHFMAYPVPIAHEGYSDKKGIFYKNLGCLIALIGFLVFMVSTSLS